MSRDKSSVCLIDDDEVYQFIFRRQMEMSSLAGDIEVFSNGKNGIEYLISLLKTPEKLPNYIFLDINMPIMDGWQFLDEFSTIDKQITKDINIYMVTSSIDERDKDKANHLSNVKEYLVKPISEHKILEVLNN